MSLLLQDHTQFELLDIGSIVSHPDFFSITGNAVHPQTVFYGVNSIAEIAGDLLLELQNLEDFICGMPSCLMTVSRSSMLADGLWCLDTRR